MYKLAETEENGEVNTNVLKEADEEDILIGISKRQSFKEGESQGSRHDHNDVMHKLSMKGYPLCVSELQDNGELLTCTCRQSII